MSTGMPALSKPLDVVDLDVDAKHQIQAIRLGLNVARCELSLAC